MNQNMTDKKKDRPFVFVLLCIQRFKYVNKTYIQYVWN